MPNAVTPAKYGNVRALFVYQRVHRALQTDYLRAVRSEVGRRERLAGFAIDGDNLGNHGAASWARYVYTGESVVSENRFEEIVFRKFG